MSHNAPFVITLVHTISSICTFDHVTSSDTLAQVHTARHLYLRCLNFCNAEMVPCIYGAAILIWRIYRRWLTLFAPVNYCTFFYAPLLFFFLAKSLYVVFGCTLSTNKTILLIDIKKDGREITSFQVTRYLRDHVLVANWELQAARSKTAAVNGISTDNCTAMWTCRRFVVELPWKLRQILTSWRVEMFQICCRPYD